MKKRMLYVGVVSGVCILLAVFLFHFFSLNPTTSGKQKAIAETPQAPPVRTVIYARGRIQPGNGVINISAAASQRILQLKVQENQFVKAGDILASLESYPECLADLDLAKANLENAKARLKAEAELAKAQIVEAELQVKNVELLKPFEIQAKQAELDLLATRLSSARRDLERMDMLKAKNTVSIQDYEHQHVAVDALEKERLSEQAIMDQLKQGYALQREEANARLKTAQANLEVVLSAVSIKALENAVALAEARLANSMIKAPADGQILKILTWSGETIGAQPVLMMGEVARMYVVAEVYETDIGKVKVGQKARMTSPALPKELNGVVEQLGVMIHKNDIFGIDPTAATDSRVIEVKILLDDPATAAAYNNLQVEAQIGL
jgi:HlyD family secretion protein